MKSEIATFRDRLADRLSSEGTAGPAKSERQVRARRYATIVFAGAPLPRGLMREKLGIPLYPRDRDIWRVHEHPEPSLRTAFPDLRRLHFGTLRTLAEAPEEAWSAMDEKTKRHALEIGWSTVRGCVDNDDPPTLAMVAALIRHGLIPDDMRGVVADLLEGIIKPRAIRPPPNLAELSAEMVFRSALTNRVYRWKKVYERRKRRTGRMLDPRQNALDRVAEESDVPRDTLERWCRPGSP